MNSRYHWNDDNLAFYVAFVRHCIYLIVVYVHMNLDLCLICLNNLVLLILLESHSLGEGWFLDLVVDKSISSNGRWRGDWGVYHPLISSLF